MISVRHALLCTVVATALFPLAACSDDPTPQPRPTPASESSSRTLEPPPPPSTPPRSPTPTQSAPADSVKAEKQIRTSWTSFFDPRSTVKERAAVMENGDQYQLMIEALAKDSKTRLLRAQVDTVKFTSDLHATVRYRLFSNGQQIGPTGPGASVRQDGTWKVSAKTVCDLTQYGKDVPQAEVC